MDMLRKKDVNSADMETVRVSRRPTTLITANGPVDLNDEATVYVRDVDLFVTVQLHEDAPPVLSLGQQCEDHRNSYE